MTTPADLAAEKLPESSAWTCPSCYKPGLPEVVQIRRDRSEGWVESSIRCCPDCKYTFGGTLADRLVHANCVYEYKYFGDYELSPEQKDAIGEMIAIANKVPGLLARIEELERALTAIAAIFPLGNQSGIDHEGIAREAFRRVGIARTALARNGEGG